MRHDNHPENARPNDLPRARIPINIRTLLLVFGIVITYTLIATRNNHDGHVGENPDSLAEKMQAAKARRDTLEKQYDNLEKLASPSLKKSPAYQKDQERIKTLFDETQFTIELNAEKLKLAIALLHASEISKKTADAFEHADCQNDERAYLALQAGQQLYGAVKESSEIMGSSKKINEIKDTTQRLQSTLEKFELATQGILQHCAMRA